MEIIISHKGLDEGVGVCVIIASGQLPAGVEIMELKVGVRKCILPGCERPFIPVVRWQVTCCEAHGRRLRWLRRKERINSALRLAEAWEEVNKEKG